MTDKHKIEDFDPAVAASAATARGVKKRTWAIHRRVLNDEGFYELHPEPAFESSDPQAVVDEAARLEEEAVDEGPVKGHAAASYAIEGDPIALGVVNVTDAHTGEVILGRKQLRRPSKKK